MLAEMNDLHFRRRKRKLLSAKTADVWNPGSSKKAYIFLRRLSKNGKCVFTSGDLSPFTPTRTAAKRKCFIFWPTELSNASAPRQVDTSLVNNARNLSQVQKTRKVRWSQPIDRDGGKWNHSTETTEILSLGLEMDMWTGQEAPRWRQTSRRGEVGSYVVGRWLWGTDGHHAERPMESPEEGRNMKTTRLFLDFFTFLFCCWEHRAWFTKAL